MRKSVKVSLLVTMSLACCLLLFSGAASAQILGFADSENGTSFASWTTTTLTVGGWAVAEEDGKPATSVQILIDGKVVGSVVPSTPRSDVVAYLGGNSAYLNCGWTVSYNVAANLTTGSHTLSVLAIDAEGASAPLTFTGTASSSLTILTPQPPQGFLDNANAATVTQSQNIVISGWAGDPQDGAPVKQVQILMDGTVVGVATLGVTRTDVAAIYPTYLKSGWSFTYGPARLAGPHTFTAVAYDKENLSTPLTVIAQNTINVLAPDMIDSLTAPASAPSGTAISVTDIATNQGNGVAPASATWFYLAGFAAATNGTFIGSRGVPSLNPGGSSTAVTTINLPAGTSGSYWVLACANASYGSFTEITMANNCSSSPITIAAPDLAESGVTVTGNTVSGGVIQVTDTVTNNIGVAPASATWFYLATSAAAQSGTLLGSRGVPSLTQGAISAGSTSITLPSNINGTYFIVACANASYGSFVESTRANNCLGSAAISVSGADLTITAVGTNPAAVLPGGSMAITDTTADAVANAGSSTTRYYLNTTTVKGGIVLGTRNVPALVASAISSGSVNVIIPASKAAGNYYVIACANDTNSVVESNVNNNCTPTPVVVYTAASTVFVDQNNVSAADNACGTSAIPCKTITEGLAAAKAGQTVLVNSGTYTEQVTIAQNVTLASVLKNTAVVQAPSVLTADSNGLTTLVTVGGGATNASVVNMGVSGPGPSSCGSINYGVFVANASATIVGNNVLSIRDNPYSGCQNGVAIRFGSQGLGFVGHTGTIAYNTVTDYQKGGIVVDGAGTNVSVLGNLVTGQNQAGVNGQNGIQISRGALSLVNNNTATNNLYANPATPLNISADGILIYDIVGGVTVTNNIVTGNDEGIGVYSDGPAATNVVIKNNTASKNAVLGIHIDANSTGNTIYTNTALNNTVDDLADENPSPTPNDWGFSPPDPTSDNNVYGTSWINQGPF